MKLAASQIGWAPEAQNEVLGRLDRLGFLGLEIAPTLAVGQNPYGAPHRAIDFARTIKKDFGLSICSMQSIWYGQNGSMFGPERAFFLDYTKKAILFAQAAGCGNLVFGCPKNRVLPQGTPPDAALPFFKEIGDFAAAHGTVVALEANPAIYGTNFVNTTADAVEMVEKVGSPGFKLNLDFGAMLQNGEDVQMLAGAPLRLVNHVHISEPELVPIKRRDEHGMLADLLRLAGYKGYVSIEQKQQPAPAFCETAQYIAGVFA